MELLADLVKRSRQGLYRFFVLNPAGLKVLVSLGSSGRLTLTCITQSLLPS